MRHSYSASFEAALRLITAGCPLDYIDHLPRESRSDCAALRISSLDGYCLAKVIQILPRVIYLIPIRLSTERGRGLIIDRWEFVGPWDQYISWDFDPRDVLPHSALPPYEHLLESHLLEIFNDRRILRRGQTIAGILCGVADFQEIPAGVEAGPMPSALLRVTAEDGVRVAVKISLCVERVVTKPVQRGPRRQITAENIFELSSSVSSERGSN